jgi:predicted GNAT family acetyltransferase
VPRIGPVYTPAEHRGHGYAAALTAAVAEDALAKGAVAVTLFADAANPTSNNVYRRIGFREVAWVVDLRFADPAAGSGSGR